MGFYGPGRGVWGRGGLLTVRVLNVKRAIPGGEADGVVMELVADDGIEAFDGGEAFPHHRFDVAPGGAAEFSAAGALIEGLLEIPDVLLQLFQKIRRPGAFGR